MARSGAPFWSSVRHRLESLRKLKGPNLKLRLVFRTPILQGSCKSSTIILRDPCMNQTLILQDSYKIDAYLARILQGFDAYVARILQEFDAYLTKITRSTLILQDLARLLRDLARWFVFLKDPCIILARPCKIAFGNRLGNTLNCVCKFFYALSS